MYAESHKRLFTVEEFHRMGELGILDDAARLELLGGEIFEMPPVGPGHQGDTDVLNMSFAPALAGRAIVRVQGPVVLDDHSEPSPDLVLLRPRADFYRQVHPRPDDVLLLVEVADTSLRYDRLDKLPRYAASGIREVWIVDRNGKRLEVHRRPSPDGYGLTQVLTVPATVAPDAFPEIVLDVAAILG